MCKGMLVKSKAICSCVINNTKLLIVVSSVLLDVYQGSVVTAMLFMRKMETEEAYRYLLLVPKFS